MICPQCRRCLPQTLWRPGPHKGMILITPSHDEHKRRRIYALLWWIGFWIVLFAVTHRPFAGGVGLPIPGVDKVAHFVLYFVLTMLGGRYLRAGGRALDVRRLIVWACVYTAYGALDEWLQQFVDRTPSWGDWLADAAGVIMATVVIWLGGRTAPPGS